MNDHQALNDQLHLGSTEEKKRRQQHQAAMQKLETTYRYRTMVATVAGHLLASVMGGEAQATNEQEFQDGIAALTVSSVSLARMVVDTAWQITPPKHFVL